MGMVEIGGTMEDLPTVKGCIPVAANQDDAISLALAQNSPVAFPDAGNNVAEQERRMNELREAAEPLRKYLSKYGDPYTSVIVTQYGATETQDERRVLFREETLAEQEAQFERELQALTGNG